MERTYREENILKLEKYGPLQSGERGGLEVSSLTKHGLTRANLTKLVLELNMA